MRGHVGLIRMRSGVFDIRALTIEEVEQAAKNGEAASLCFLWTHCFGFGSLNWIRKDAETRWINKAVWSGQVQGIFRRWRVLMLGEVAADGQLVSKTLNSMRYRKGYHRYERRKK